MVKIVTASAFVPSLSPQVCWALFGHSHIGRTPTKLLHLQLSACAGGCRLTPPQLAQEAFERLYASPEAAQHYHAKCNLDPDARVGPWEGGRREVVFAVPAPALLAKAVGETAAASAIAHRTKLGSCSALVGALARFTR